MKNVLILCSHDGVLAGHAKFIYNMIPNKENKRIVTYISKYNKEPYAFHYSQSKFFILYRKLKKAISLLSAGLSMENQWLLIKIIVNIVFYIMMIVVFQQKPY